MADDKPAKRPKYFKSQFLVLRDFEDEQAYHQEMLGRHNAGLHSWGVVKDGIQVGSGGMGPAFYPGLAIDNRGREIVVDKDGALFFLKANGTDQYKMIWVEVDGDSPSYFEMPNDLFQAAATATGSKTDVYLTISFQEIPSDDAEDQYPPTGAKIDVTRYKPAPLITVVKTPPDDGSSIVLAKFSADLNGQFTMLYNSARTLAGCIGPLSFTSGSVDNNKVMADNMPQFRIDYDAMADALTIKARSHSIPGLDATPLVIQRDTGNVGIGTKSPKQRLHVVGATTDPGSSASWPLWVAGGNDSDRIMLASVGTGANQYGVLASASSANWTNTSINPYGGNVGIGTGAQQPRQKLEVAGNLQLSGGRTKLFYRGDFDAHIGSLGFYSPDGGNTAIITPYNGVGDNLSNSTISLGGFGFFEGNVVNLSVSGNVGIGTQHDPVIALMVKGAVDAFQYMTSNHSLAVPAVGKSGGAGDRMILQSGDAGSHPYSLGIDSNNLWYSVPRGARHSWHIGGAEMLRVDSTGNVGIGTTTPKAKLDVADTTANTTKSILARLSEGNTTGAGTYLGVQAYDTQPASTKSFALEHYFIGKLNNAINFYRGGGETGGMITFSTGTGKEVVLINNKGTVTIAGDAQIDGKISCGGKIGLRSAQWGTFVSAREDKKTIMQAPALDTYELFSLEMSCSRAFKENVSDLTAGEALATLQHLTPVKYDYKGEKSFRQNMGFIAEDMPDNLSSHDRKSISPFEVIPVLTKVAKEQQQTITALQETICALQEQLERHNSIINGGRF